MTQQQPSVELLDFDHPKCSNIIKSESAFHPHSAMFGANPTSKKSLGQKTDTRKKNKTPLYKLKGAKGTRLEGTTKDWPKI